MIRGVHIENGSTLIVDVKSTNCRIIDGVPGCHPLDVVETQEFGHDRLIEPSVAHDTYAVVATAVPSH